MDSPELTQRVFFSGHREAPQLCNARRYKGVNQELVAPMLVFVPYTPCLELGHYWAEIVYSDLVISDLKGEEKIQLV